MNHGSTGSEPCVYGCSDLVDSHGSRYGGSMLLCELGTSKDLVSDQQDDTASDKRCNKADRSEWTFVASAMKMFSCSGGSKVSPWCPLCSLGLGSDRAPDPGPV